MRKSKNRKLKLKYAVIGDGQTEQFYFKHLKKIMDFSYSVRPSLFANINFVKAEEIIDELLDSGINGIVYITDYDTIINQNKKNNFNKFLKKYKNNDKVIICESMPSIEFWFLLHYTKTTSSFSSSSEVESALKKFIPKYEKRIIWLKNSKWVEFLCSENKIDKAYARAEEIYFQKVNKNVGSHFPYTLIFMAMKKFKEWKKI